MAFIYGAGTVHLNDKDRGYYYFNGTNPALSDNYTFQQDEFATYSYLDYILVGGGGGGAGSFVTLLTPFPAGGGGSGIITASFPHTGNNNGFIYSVASTGSGTINLTGITSIQIQIGQGGAGYPSGGTPGLYSGANGLSTILTTFTGATQIQQMTAGGGSGGVGFNPPASGGDGGAGFNGGGGGGDVGYSITNINGVGGTTTGGGTNGGNFSFVVGPPLIGTSGSGGGVGGGNGYSITLPNPVGLNVYDSNISGAGAGGSSVTLQSGARTGGDATGGVTSNDVTYILPVPPTPTAGYDYTGGGGAGGCLAFIYSGGVPIGTTYTQNGTNGGKGYAILYFHN